MKIIMFGPPGAGKGTITEMIKVNHDIEHISTGDLLREAAKAGTDLGLKAKEFMDRGDLVPDDIVISLIKQKLEETNAAEGYILDGFPRDIEQAKALKMEGISIDNVVDLVVPDEVVVERISARRICPSCQMAYNTIFMAPKEEGVCDKCGTELKTRDDDQPDAVKHRLEVYKEKTEPLIKYYEGFGMLLKVDAEPNDPMVVYENVKKALNLD